MISGYGHACRCRRVLRKSVRAAAAHKEMTGIHTRLQKVMSFNACPSSVPRFKKVCARHAQTWRSRTHLSRWIRSPAPTDNAMHCDMQGRTSQSRQRRTPGVCSRSNITRKEMRGDQRQKAQSVSGTGFKLAWGGIARGVDLRRLSARDCRVAPSPAAHIWYTVSEIVEESR
jgi:hypothetical protein